ncbi:MAG: type II secretion system F family protein [Methanosarcinaceae archaeon]
MNNIIYRSIGKPIDRKNIFLEKPLEQARMGMTAGQYVSIGILIGIPVVLVILLLYFTFSRMLLFFIIPLYVMLFVAYPFWKVSNRASEIEKDLPHALNYISTMVAVGVSTPKVFQSISRESSFGEIRKEFDDIYRDIDFFGADLSTALLRAAARTPSKDLANTFNNIIAMLAAGSDLSTVLRNTAEMQIRQYYRKLDRVVDNLSLFAEIYIILAVFVPILFLITFPVVEVITNFFAGAFGTEPIQIINKATVEAVIYLIIPIVSVISLILLDIIIPEDMKI